MKGNQMFKVTQYRPAFFEGFNTKTAIVEKPEDALNLPWLKNKGTLSLDGDPSFQMYVMHGILIVALIHPKETK